MKGLIIALMLTLGISTMYAQERGQRPGNFNPEERAKAQVERLEKELGLNAQQKESIYKITMDQSKAQQALFQNSRDNREEARTKMLELRKQTDEKINALLDDSQKVKYAAFQKQQQERRGPGQGERSGRQRDSRN